MVQVRAWWVRAWVDEWVGGEQRRGGEIQKFSPVTIYLRNIATKFQVNKVKGQNLYGNICKHVETINFNQQLDFCATRLIRL